MSIVRCLQRHEELLPSAATVTTQLWAILFRSTFQVTQVTSVEGIVPLFSQNQRDLGHPAADSFWQARYYDFNVWSEAKFVEKLRYIHRNPVVRGLVERPEDRLWSSFRHYFTGADGVVEIESQWIARRREGLGIMPTARVHENPAQAKLERGTRKSRLEG